MPKTLRIRTTVQPGGRVEFASPELEAGQTVVEVRPIRGRTGRVESEGANIEGGRAVNWTGLPSDPAVMGGKACVLGMRVTGGMVVGLLAAGRSRAEILEAYPYLEEEDIGQCLAYAAWRDAGTRSCALRAMMLKFLAATVRNTCGLGVNIPNYHRDVHKR